MGFVTCYKRDNDSFYRLTASPKDSHYLLISEGRAFKENNVWFLYFVTPNPIEAKQQVGDDQNKKWIPFTVEAGSLCRLAFDPGKTPAYEALTLLTDESSFYQGVWRFDPNVLQYEPNNFLAQTFGGLKLMTTEPSDVLKNLTHTANSGGGGGGKKGYGGGGGAPKQTEYEVLQDRKKWVLEQYRSFISLNSEKITDDIRKEIMESQDLVHIASCFDSDYWGYPTSNDIDSHPANPSDVKAIFDEMVGLIVGLPRIVKSTKKTVSNKSEDIQF